MADIGKIAKREIVEEMRESYLDYAMSVIVARALPDVRDGLKPVHRRILFAMREMGLGPGARYRKSAAVVGDCLGKYHPHGDLAVYDALVRMAQDFSLRYPLVDGQGNFGSLDGDAAAAQRYTEVRLTPLAEEMLRDIDRDTVPFAANYDATREEPTVLPAAAPNLLLNGSLGIAVGMATNIPPHHLGEIVDALRALIQKPDTTHEELMAIVRGPDFPTGGTIYDEAAIRASYAAGRGAILVRGNAEIVERKDGGAQIVITEIPYQVVKAELIAKIALLVREKKLEGIRDLRDESDKEGLRIAVDLKADAVPQKVLNGLYRFTDLERNFNLNLLALVDGIQPQVLSLKGALEEYLKHRVAVVTRRSHFELARARERIHVLEGLTRALGNIDAVIQTIRRSRDRAAAHQNLRAAFKLSDAQAAAILDMRLATLAALEREKVAAELKELQARARTLEALLKDPAKIRAEIAGELAQLKAKYGDERRTTVVRHPARAFTPEDLIPEEETVVTLTRGGYIKRLRPGSYRLQRRGGKGTQGMATKEEDAVTHFLAAHTHADLLFFTSSAKVFALKAYEVPEGSRTAKGRAIFNFLALRPEERIMSIVARPPAAKGAAGSQFLTMVTERGMIKRVPAAAFVNVRRSGIVALTLRAGDALRGAALTTGRDELILVTARGQAIRFREGEVRAMGRAAAGVKAMRPKGEDRIVGLNIAAGGDAGVELLVILANGFGKRTPVKQYRRQRRGGTGIRAAKVTAKSGPIVASRIIRGEAELIAISRRGQVIRTNLGDVPVLGRTTQGVRIMRLEPGDTLTSIIAL